jgi:hypothetical protein
LTLLENWLERNAGVEPDQGGCLLHYLEARLPEYFFKDANNCGRNHLRAESCILWPAILEVLDFAGGMLTHAAVPEWIIYNAHLRRGPVAMTS